MLCFLSRQLISLVQSRSCYLTVSLMTPPSLRGIRRGLRGLLGSFLSSSFILKCLSQDRFFVFHKAKTEAAATNKQKNWPSYTPQKQNKQNKTTTTQKLWCQLVLDNNSTVKCKQSTGSGMRHICWSAFWKLRQSLHPYCTIVLVSWRPPPPEHALGVLFSPSPFLALLSWTSSHSPDPFALNENLRFE